MNAAIIGVAIARFLFAGVSQEQHQDKPQDETAWHEQHKAAPDDRRHQGVGERGDQVMGFSHEKTTHHFRLYADGGAIEAQANDAQDTASRARGTIQYHVENGERGARLRITTKALQAVHQFLRFQIAAHQTGDATEITKVP